MCRSVSSPGPAHGLSVYPWLMCLHTSPWRLLRPTDKRRIRLVLVRSPFQPVENAGERGECDACEGAGGLATILHSRLYTEIFSPSMKISRALWLLAGLTSLFCIILVTDVIPWLRGAVPWLPGDSAWI